jgi:uncharacterized lipoprotein YddW (UPF0748 family)
VWLATVAGLDWPQTTDRDEQEASLRHIIDSLRVGGFNTLFFQVRARGDAYYRSSFEPWAENLTGTLGKDPGWDPLSFIIQYAHKSGIEVHAWFNVFKIRSGNHLTASIPPHPARAHPEWTVTVAGETWLDPGIPAVRLYLVKVATDLARRYDIDGINFDYARYPGRDFPDENTYRRYGGSQPKDDWRRTNVSRFIAESYNAITALKPWVKVGASPLGYLGLPDDPTTGAVANFYQDARAWLKSGKVDYVAPQLYWEIGEPRKELDFATLLAAWIRGASGRHVYAGIAAYKPGVAQHLGSYVDTSRSWGCSGESYFRWENLIGQGTIEGRYAAQALIPPMPWKSAALPLPPPLLAVTEGEKNVFHLEWLRDTLSAIRPSRYAVYRWNASPVPFSESGELVGVTTDSTCTWTDTLRSPTGPVASYAVTAIDRFDSESPPSSTVSVITREFLALRGKLTDTMGLSALFSSSAGAPRLVGYSLPKRTEVALRLLAVIPGKPDSLVATLEHGTREEGTHVVGMNGLPLAPGKYLVRLTTGEGELTQDVDLR